MDENLFDQIDIEKSNTKVPDGMAENPLDVGPAYEKLIEKAGGIDLQVLGVGTDGHIGFNEPTSSLGSITRVKTLTQQTIEDNSRFFKPDEFQPKLAITMGIKTILDAEGSCCWPMERTKLKQFAIWSKDPFLPSVQHLHYNPSKNNCFNR